jgi:hypothetical protein
LSGPGAVAHSSLAIGLPPVKNAFVILAILIAPLVAAALAWLEPTSALYGAFRLGSLSPAPAASTGAGKMDRSER